MPFFKRVKYPCNSCEYKVKELNGIKRHKMSVQESMKYACNLCGYKATQKNHLNSHKYLFHNNIVYLKTNLSKPYFIFNLL